MEEEPRKDKWERKPGIDLWSIPHVLFGMLMGAVPALTGMSAAGGFALTALLSLLWEVGENLFHIEESSLNSAMDVLLAIAAYSVVVIGLWAYPLDTPHVIVVTTAVFLVYAYTNISGWFAYRRRHKDFRR